MTATNKHASYSQALKPSVIMGGAAGLNLLLGMIRVKFAAVFIGATGVGLLASLTALQGLVATVLGLGVQSSAVRDIAAAVAKGDEQEIGRTVVALRRICWLTGLIGMATVMLLSPLLSYVTFGHQGHALSIASLGVIILFGNVSGGQMALIQGTRRISDLARAQIVGAGLGTLAAICFYAALGVDGIVPTLVTASVIQLGLSFYFARQVHVPSVRLTWLQTFTCANSMLRLGLVMMWNGLLSSLVVYLTVTLIAQYHGTLAVGIYSAAYALSGMFVNFVLTAMGADYYPRLTGVAHDKTAVNRLVGEQTEIGLLLSLPGLVATMALAPWIVQIFYTREFLASVDLLQWFILACVGRVISWPLGFVMLALGKTNWFLVAETTFNLFHITLVAIGLHLYGVEGVAIASVATYACYIVVVYWVSTQLTGFSWSAECVRLCLFAFLPLGAIFAASRLLPLWPATLLGILSTFVVGVLCLRGLASRVGSEHRIVRLIVRLPGGKLLLSGC